MKAINFTITNEEARKNCITRINEIDPNGKTTVSIKPAGSKSSRQRGLQWRWNTDVSFSGIGGRHESTKEGVHLLSKYTWAIPILIRDNPFFSDLYTAYLNKWSKDPERMKYFVENHVHTESFNVSQMAEFLTSFQNYYIDKGVELTMPEDGLLG